MRRVLLTLIFVASALGLSAQMRTSYFMEGSYFRTELNPALAPTRGYIAIPVLSGVGVGINNNFISVDNFIYNRDGHTVTAYDGRVSASEFLSRLPKKGYLSQTTNLNILGVGFYDKHDMFWNFGVNVHIGGDVTIGKEFFELTKQLGNGHRDFSSAAFDATAYTELYLGWNMDVLDFVTIGAKLKGLIGIMNISGSFSDMTANVGSDSISAFLRGNLRGSGIMTSDGYLVGDDMDLDRMLTLISVTPKFENLKSGGFAVDLGAEVRLFDDHLKVSAAITDLGFIKWSDQGAVATDMAFDITYKGFDLNAGEVDFDGGEGSFKIAKPAAYTRRLNTTLNVGAEYNVLDNHIGFGLLSHTEFHPIYTSSELTASVNFRPSKWFTATLSHTLCNSNAPGVFGFALNLHPRGLNLFVGMDYIDTSFVRYSGVVIPKRLKSFNTYFGLGFNL